MKETLTKKVGGMPVWAWTVAGSAILAFIIWKRQKATNAATTGSGNPSNAATTTAPLIVNGSTTPTGGVTPPPVPPVVGHNNTPDKVPNREPRVGALAGSGFGVVPGHDIISSADGNNYQYVATPAQVTALGGYGSLFFQPFPGVFKPWNPQLVSGTPMFAQVPYSATVAAPEGSGGAKGVRNTQFSKARSPASALAPFAQVAA